MNTSTIQRKVINNCIHYGHSLVVKNFYLFEGWECDVLSVNYSDYTTEFEVKRTRNDFIADFKKKDKHFHTSNGYGCNYFYYVCPQGLIKKDEIPEYAGLMYASPKGLRPVKIAPVLHQDKITFKQLKKIAVKIMSSKYV